MSDTNRDGYWGDLRCAAKGAMKQVNIFFVENGESHINDNHLGVIENVLKHYQQLIETYRMAEANCQYREDGTDKYQEYQKFPSKKENEK